MLFLVSGHQDGSIKVWDMKKFKILSVIKDENQNLGEIRAAKFVNS